jgi:hypothetical protein
MRLWCGYFRRLLVIDYDRVLMYRQRRFGTYFKLGNEREWTRREMEVASALSRDVPISH